MLVADGGRMLLLRNDGDADAPDLTVIAHRDGVAPPDRDLFDDAPGRTFQSHGPGRSAYDSGSLHDALERAFLASAAESLADHLEPETPGVIVVADPVSLGLLRQHYPPGAKAKLLAELGRDFTGMTTETIIRQLALA
ncbi:MAG: host attachment family protein [Porphyrobacter sp.]|nr:host attachment family protein [Porphyrobacter sp.]